MDGGVSFGMLTKLGLMVLVLGGVVLYVRSRQTQKQPTRGGLLDPTA